MAKILFEIPAWHGQDPRLRRWTHVVETGRHRDVYAVDTCLRVIDRYKGEYETCVSKYDKTHAYLVDTCLHIIDQYRGEYETCVSEYDKYRAKDIEKGQFKSLSFKELYAFKWKGISKAPSVKRIFKHYESDEEAYKGHLALIESL